MIRVPTVLSGYFGRQFVVGVTTMMGVLLSLILVIDLAELFRRAWGRESVTVLLVIQMALLKLPYMAQKVLPFATLFGGLLAFFRLTRTNQLVVARASGLSVWQFLFPSLLSAFVFGTFVTTIFNPLASATEALFETLEARYLRGRPSLLAVSDSGIWLRQADDRGQSVIHSSVVSQRGTELRDVIVFLYEGSDRFIGRIDAASAVLENGRWRLSDAILSGPDTPAVREDVHYLPTTLTFSQIQESFASPETLSFWSLPRFIDTLEQAGFSATRHRIHFHALLSVPLLLCAMVIIAATFSLRFTRLGSGGILAVGGVLAGFLLFFLSDVIYALGLSGALPVVLAAWSPALISSLLGIAMLLHLEDG
jgi:lipopolysaccharide export system permease protein